MATLFDSFSPPASVDLRVGAPGEEALKYSSRVMTEAATKRLAEPDSFMMFEYGPSTGSSHFKETLATFLAKEYKDPVNTCDIIQTSGATHGLFLLANLFFSSGDLAITEGLTYFLAIKVLRYDLQMNLQSVLIDEEGINPDELEKVLKANSASRERWKPTSKRPFWALLYLMPTFHNPSGVCLSPARCKRVVELAREYDLLVVCDDVYNCLYFPDSFKDGHPPKRLFAYDDRNDPGYKGNIVSNGTFSKIFGPGVRVGWLEAPKNVADIVGSSGVLHSGGATNHMTACLLSVIMEQGTMSLLVEQARMLHQDNCRAIISVIKERIPTIEIQEPAGGYFLWIKLPDSCSVSGTALSAKCLEEFNVLFWGGESSSPGGKHTNYIRLSFIRYPKQTLTDAVRKVADMIARLS